MTNYEIIQMARQAGLSNPLWIENDYAIIETFAKLVADKEREACAKTAETIETYEKIEKACFKFAAKTIRARGEA
jgi:hypothetical protein